ncbi:MAG: hypothetical protein ABW321_07420 [Polyangiales bacterium]
MLRATLCLAVLLPLLELGAHAWIVGHVPALADYRAASDFIRAELQPHDLVTAAPSFIDPILRWQLGDKIPLAMAGRSDEAGYDRLWVLSSRGARPALDSTPLAAAELTRDFGELQVLRYRLPQREVLFDFVKAWPQAEAAAIRGGSTQPCRLQQGGSPRGGGLGRGVLMPVRRRFECDARNPWLFIADVVMEDLDNTPRYCVWQHPQGTEPITLTYRDVPLGSELVFAGGLYYEHERMREGAPVDAVIAVDGSPLATLHHVDGDGWKRLHIATAALGKTRGDVSIAVSSSQPQARSFCWAASTRQAPEPGPQP